MRKRSRTFSPHTRRQKNDVPRSVIVSFKKGDDGKDQGDRAVVKSKLPRSMSMAEKFQANAEAADGFVSINRWTYLRQGTIDEWGVTQLGADGQSIEFFTPRKFKDAEAVSFNNKTFSAISYITTTTVANGEPMNDLYVQYSHVRVNLHNITQRRITVQMFICYGKNSEGTFDAVDDLEKCYDYYRNGSNLTARTVNIDPMANKEWLKIWDVTKVEFKLEQGEHQTYLIKGPKNYVMDPKLHLPQGTLPAPLDVTWDGPQKAGNGCRVFFRMLNEICLVGNNDAATAPTTLMGRKIGAHHPINPIPGADGAQQGCCIVRMSEYTHVKAPVGLTTNDSKIHLSNFHTIAGATYTESNVDTDQAMTVPATFL